MSTKLHYGWVILAAAILAILGSLGLGRFGYTVILPLMREGLALDDGKAGALATANSLGYLLGALSVGVIAFRAKKRTLITISLLAGAAAMSFTGFARSFAVAAVGRFLTGLAAAGVNVTSMGLLSIWFSRRKRGLATGLAVGGSSLGLLITGLGLPPLMSGPSGWRWGWQAIAAAAALIAVLAWALLRENPRELGLEPLGSEPEPARPAETRSPDAPPRIEKGIINVVFSDPYARLLCLIYFCYGFSYIVFSTFYVRYLAAEGGFSLEEASKLWACIGALSFLGGLAWGAFSDRFGRKIAFFLSYAILSAALFMIGIWKTAPGILIASLAFALTAWSVIALMAATVGDIMGKRAPEAFGIVTFCFGLGQAAGPVAAGAVADAKGSFTWSFIMAAGVAAAGAILSLFLRKNNGKRIAPESPT